MHSPPAQLTSALSVHLGIRGIRGRRGRSSPGILDADVVFSASWSSRDRVYHGAYIVATAMILTTAGPPLDVLSKRGFGAGRSIGEAE